MACYGKSAVFFVAFVSTAFAGQRASAVCQRGAQVAVNSGITSQEAISGTYPACTVTVRVAGTSKLANIYSDGSQTALRNPFSSDSSGRWSFYGPDGSYEITMSGAGFTSPYTIEAQLYDGGRLGMQI